MKLRKFLTAQETPSIDLCIYVTSVDYKFDDCVCVCNAGVPVCLFKFY